VSEEGKGNVLVAGDDDKEVVAGGIGIGTESVTVTGVKVVNEPWIGKEGETEVAAAAVVEDEIGSRAAGGTADVGTGGDNPVVDLVD
jgi:hypothetical protein